MVDINSIKRKMIEEAYLDTILDVKEDAAGRYVDVTGELKHERTTFRIMLQDGVMIQAVR